MISMEGVEFRIEDIINTIDDLSDKEKVVVMIGACCEIQGIRDDLISTYKAVQAVYLLELHEENV